MDFIVDLLNAQLTLGNDLHILWREIVGNLFGLASAVGGMRRRVWAWPVGIIGNLLLFTVFLGSVFAGVLETPQEHDLYGQAGRQVFFIVGVDLRLDPMDAGQARANAVPWRNRRGRARDRATVGQPQRAHRADRWPRPLAPWCSRRSSARSARTGSGLTPGSSPGRFSPRTGWRGAGRSSG